MPTVHHHEEKPLGALLSDLARDASTLVRQEVRLARAEINEKISNLRSGVMSLGAGALIAFAGLIILLEAAVYGLAIWLDPWLSALIVGGVAVLIGVILLMVGRSNLSAERLTPHRTAESLRKDKELAKEQVR